MSGHYAATPFAVAALAILAAIANTAPCVAAPQAERPSVLVLYGLQSFMPIVLDWDRGMRSAIKSHYDGPVRIETEYLDLLRSEDIDYQEQWMALLRRKYEDNKPDVIIAVFDPGLKFILEQRDSLFPDVPVVFCSAHFYETNGVRLPTGITGVKYQISYGRTLDLARQLRPEARKVAVVSAHLTLLV